VIPSAATRHWLSRSARQYAYALWMAALFTIVTIKVFWLTDAALVTALNGPYGALCIGGPAMIAACIGIARWQPQPPFQSHEPRGGADGRENH